jgi:hypothetical protein
MQRNRAGFLVAMKGRSMGRLFRLGLVSLAFFAFGCAHQIAITPAPDAFNAGGISRIDKNVGYYITPENLAKEVVTPGGGGDKVKYSPYKESEPTLKQVLSNLFRDVYRLPSPSDAEFHKVEEHFLHLHPDNYHRFFLTKFLDLASERFHGITRL